MVKKRGIFLYFIAALIATGVFLFCFYIRESSLTTASAQVAQPRQIQIEVAFGARRWRFSAKDLEAKSAIHTVELDLAKAKELKTYEQKQDCLNRIEKMGFKRGTGIRYLFPNLDKRLDEIVAHIDRAPIPANIKFYPNRTAMFEIIRERDGIKVDKQGLLEEIEMRFKESPKVYVVAKTQSVKSEITSEIVRNGTFLRSRFSTGYAQSSNERKHNVRLGLKKFNGMRVEPDCEVSFNRVVGKRTAANGFLEAKIIKGGVFENGYGGGVCQSSTTLYNAVLLADLKVLRAQQHSLQVGYVEPSFDAMVNSGSGDLVFKNTTKLPVFIKTYSDDSRVFVEIYGEKPRYRIVRQSIVTEKIPALPDEFIVDHKQKYLDKAPYKGEKVRVQTPKEGLKSEGYLLYYSEDGTLNKRELIRKNSYAPQKGIVVEGILQKPAPPPPKEQATPKDLEQPQPYLDYYLP